MDYPISLGDIRTITVSGRIGSGATTLAKQLADTFHWRFWEAGSLTEKFYAEKLKVSEVNVEARPDSYDLQLDKSIKEMASSESNNVIQAHLAGFLTQGIQGVFKILVVCEGENENDKTDIRIDRLVNRKAVSIKEAKEEIKKREEGNVAQWKRLYTKDDPTWVYWRKNYYDLVINTYTHNKEESVNEVFKALGYQG